MVLQKFMYFIIDKYSTSIFWIKISFNYYPYESVIYR